MIFNKGAKTFNGGKDNLPNMWFWANRLSALKRMKLSPYRTPHTKINSKGNKDLKVRAETTKFLKENIGAKLRDVRFGN